MRPAQKVLRTARKTTRRQDYSSSTKRALVKHATELFTDHGYAGTSLDEVVAAARVTKGALYHHFPSKLALFEAVFMRCQDDATAQIDKALKASRDPWERAQIGLRTFLDTCQQPNYRRICLQEAPVALGHERWQEAERESSYGLVERIVSDLLDELGSEKELAETFGVIFYGAMRTAGEFVADAADPVQASSDVETVIGSILVGLRLTPTFGEGENGDDTEVTTDAVKNQK